MRIFLWELKKALSTSVIWGFLAVCLLFNVILVISNTYNRNYIQYISGAVAQYGQKVDDEFIEKLKDAGAEGVILGCTELGLLLRQSNVSIPLFDTTVIHAKRAAQIAMEDCVQQ